MRFTAATTVWGVIVVSWLSCGFLAVLFLHQAGFLSLPFLFGERIPERTTVLQKLPNLLSLLQWSPTTWKVIAWVSVIVVCLLLVLIAAMTKSIQASIVIMKQASSVMSRIPSLIAYDSPSIINRMPLLSSITIAILSFCFVLAIVFTLSSPPALEESSLRKTSCVDELESRSVRFHSRAGILHPLLLLESRLYLLPVLLPVVRSVRSRRFLDDHLGSDWRMVLPQERGSRISANELSQ